MLCLLSDRIGTNCRIVLLGIVLSCCFGSLGGCCELFPNSCPCPNVVPIACSFDAGNAGWRLIGGTFSSPTAPVFNPTGGSADGHLSGTDNDQTYWLAPNEFIGDKRCYYGQTLSFDLDSSVSLERGCEDALNFVVLSGNGMTIQLNAPYLPQNAWTNFTVHLDDSERWVFADSNQDVTASQIRDVLMGLTELRIKAWYFGCGIEGVGGLDNVVLGGHPLDLTGASIQSDFAASDDGWTVAGGSFDRQGTVTWHSTDGSPAGHATATGQDAWYWMAPPKFRGEASKAYGQTLKFDLNQSVPLIVGCVNSDGLVVLEGGGHEIHYNAPYLPAQTWTSYAVQLSESELWYEGSNQRVTVDTMKAVLADLKQIKIRGWFFGCGTNGTGGIDNVLLLLTNAPPPAPASPNSTFDQSNDDWDVAGGSFERAGVETWSGSDGSPGGHTTATGEDAWYWMAPPGFRGNGSKAYGQMLRFDLNQSVPLSAGCTEAMALVVLDGGGHEIYFNAPYLPAQTWTSYAVRLSESELWYEGPNRRITVDTMKAVLADLQQIKIRGWFFGCGLNGTGGLDNVQLVMDADPPPPALASPFSTFKDDADGWTVAAGQFDRAGVVSWNATSGTPIGSAAATGQDAWYWMAPPKFRGDASHAYGRALSFDLNQSIPLSQGCFEQQRLVVLDGGGHEIYFNGTQAPNQTWTHYAILLSESELWFESASNARVSRDVMQAVLANLQQVKIRGWYFGCDKNGIGGIDNVSIDIGN